MTAYFKKIFSSVELRNKILFTAALFLVYRLLAHIPVPGVNVDQLKTLFNSSQFLSLLNIFSGGTLANFSVVAVGINPYITASIIMQLAAMVIPSLKEQQKESESGREKINQYTRLLSIPLAVAQSVSVLAILNSQGLLSQSDPFTLSTIVITLVAGATVMMWLGELITQYGIGNGISMILLVSIISQIPTSIAQLISVSATQNWLILITLGLILIATIGLIVFMNEGIRKVSIEYAKRVRGSKVYGGQQTHLPIKVNVTGVMPIIFAVSIMLVPSFIARILTATKNPQLIEIGQQLTVLFAQTSLVYIVLYFLIVFFFTFFSALIFFNAEDISNELKKSGAFIPGIRPGSATKKFLEYVVSRITFAGAIFLGVLAIFPMLAQRFTDIGALAIGGTSLLIVVSVILETTKQVQSYVVDQNYDKYLK